MTALSKPFGNDRTMPAQHELMPTGTPPTQEEVEAAFIGEMPKLTGKIEVREYAQQWPALYEREAARLLAVLGGKILALEHVGSTSVPGLAAKPIIDLTVENSADETAYTGLNSIPGNSTRMCSVAQLYKSTPSRPVFSASHPVRKNRLDAQSIFRSRITCWWGRRTRPGR